MISRLDHLVLTVADIAATVAFYTGALGMRVETFGPERRTALVFGGPDAPQKINLHAVERTFSPGAAAPTPGSADLCFLVDDLEAAAARIAAAGVAITEGPLVRTGAGGPLRSLYCRDPDGNLIEVSEPLDGASDGHVPQAARPPRPIGQPDTALLTVEEMALADRRTIAAGTPGHVLMARAGAAVAGVARTLVAPGAQIAILAGPGNNGGDGWVAASELSDAGFDVTVWHLGARDALKGDAARAAAAWQGAAEPLSEGWQPPQGPALVVDALFGAGLTRPLEGAGARAVERLNAARPHAARVEDGRPLKVLAVDVPSGIDGNTGQVRGSAIEADVTVSFFRAKPGHVLQPGRAHAGTLHVVDIGIAPDVLTEIAPKAHLNRATVAPGLAVAGHKYDRGHAVVVAGGPTRTGAARLAAQAALRVAGLVTVAAPPESLLVCGAHLTAVMLTRIAGAHDLATLLVDRRRNAVVVGPAAGVGAETRDLVLAALESQAATVLDADALTSFSDAPETLFAAIRARAAPTVLTPHAGEFARLFPDLAQASVGKPVAAREAARRSGAVVVMKGADTVTAAPDGRITLDDQAPAWLATAGSGDVLAGLIAGYLANGRAGPEAAAAGVRLHAWAARTLGPGMTADDLSAAVPQALRAVATVGA